MNRESVFLFTGGSGGHVYPALVLKEDLESQGYRTILFVSNFSNFKAEPGIRSFKVSKSKPLALIQSLYMFNHLLMLFILRKTRIAVGFGGYYSLAGIVAAKVLRRKTFIYEPNMALGRANKILAYFIDRILVLWPEISLKPELEPKIRRIMPLIKKRSSVVVKDKRGLFSVLFAGGSSGSMFLNNLFTEIIQSDFFKGQDLKLVLIAGDKFYHKVKERVDSLHISSNINVEVYGFRNDVEIFIDEFDFLISRAGAQVIVESIFSEIPTLYIPYPYAGEHQLQNARNILSKRCCFIIRQELADVKAVVRFIKYLARNRESLNRTKDRLRQLKDDFKKADRSIDIILK
ncbi:MAG: UDP-N-acetylglucosamine--N-acetylmuramyl-(pentapeptide) pyrophosphoryl-undecaprenol N-acetylglucosamine transferase [Candidatus Kaelpia aquatica]|nr:UDP-N-acetylglucosamine--N-acetylmuramyl-(pentapeptide) pyrophosphoryl-undecaprenol N-acetylglucosamine transferase [Candidatus Kaelpia aquatica]